MIKTITKTFEANVCDYCDEGEDFSRGLELSKCSLCGKEICSYCSAGVHIYPREDEGCQGNVKRVTICRSHLPEGLE